MKSNGLLSLPLLSEKIQNCTACPLCSVPINPLEFLPENETLLMVIAQNPSAEEHLLNAPWVDRHSFYVKTLLAPIFPSNKTYFTYMVKCSVAEKIGVKNSDACRSEFLLDEETLLKPKIILTLGENCNKILLGRFVKKPKYGDIFVDKNTNGTIFRAAWKAPFVMLNEGKGQQKKSIEFFNKLKTLLPNL